MHLNLHLFDLQLYFVEQYIFGLKIYQEINLSINARFPRLVGEYLLV